MSIWYKVELENKTGSQGYNFDSLGEANQKYEELLKTMILGDKITLHCASPRPGSFGHKFGIRYDVNLLKVYVK